MRARSTPTLKPLLRRAFALVALALALVPAAHAATPPPLTVFAAASLQESLDEAARLYTGSTGQPVRISYASSSALARQIEHGAPADVYFPADTDWMDYLQRRGLIASGTRHAALGNALVLIAPKSGTAEPLTLAHGVDLQRTLGDGRLALALTASVPAGRYARAALVSLGAWDAVAPRVVETENVRAALRLVARGEATLGVVYASDALADPQVRVLGRFPASSHPPIVYPVAVTAPSRHPHAAHFVRWLRTPAATAVFRTRGFRTP